MRYLLIFVLTTIPLAQIRIPGPGGSVPTGGGVGPTAPTANVASCNPSGTGTTNACTFSPSSPTPGNTVVCTMLVDDFTGGLTFGATDNQSGNTYTAVTARSATSSHMAALQFVAKNVNSSGTFTVTFSLSTADYRTGSCYEFSGASASAPLDATGATSSNTNTGNATPFNVSTSGSTTAANELVIGSFVVDGGATVPSACSGYTILNSQKNPTVGWSMFDVYKLVTSTATQSACGQVTITSSTGYAGMVSTYK